MVTDEVDVQVSITFTAPAFAIPGLAENIMKALPLTSRVVIVECHEVA